MGQACIASFDCFRHDLAPFTLRKGRGLNSTSQTHFGSLCGLLATAIIIGVLALAALPRIDLILSEQPLSYYQISQERQDTIRIE